MSQLFNTIKVGAPNRSTFDLSHHQVTTSDFGYLVPICYRDMIPNDDFVVTPNVFVRLASLAYPTYGKIKCRFHHFFVPYRILYPYWDAFITQDGSNHTVPPYFLVSTLLSAIRSDPAYNIVATGRRQVFGRLMSNLGINPDILFRLPQDQKISAFPFLAYYRIWMDWFADVNIYDHATLVEAFNQDIADGGSLATHTDYLYTRNCCYKKDYFTTAKLNPQSGDDPSRVGVEIGSHVNPGLFEGSNNRLNFDPQSEKVFRGEAVPSVANDFIGQFTIEALRAANSLQRYLERNNFVGSKIIDRILAHFGVRPEPERLDMSEFLGGSSMPIQIGDITSTAAVTGSPNLSTKNLGVFAGKGVGAAQGDTIRYHAKEHGIYMTLMSILPDTGYYQGLSRMWTKGLDGDALDFYHPEFENLGYQELLNKEVYVPGQFNELYSSYDPDGVFGYTPRYSEYKFQQDILAGDLVAVLSGLGPSSESNVLGANYNSVHLFRTFEYNDDNPLALNENFVELDNYNNNYDRIFQVTSRNFDHFFFNVDMDVKATRPMSGFGEPSLDVNNSEDGHSMNLPYGGTRL